MQDNIVLDVNEDDINQLNRDLLATLLFDRTTRKNILWGTDDYKDLGDAYAAGNPITEYLITGSNGKVIQPRVLKAQEQKKDRTRARAEVFTPSWVCNAQNNLVDAEWFGGESPFNEVSGTEWKATTEPIHFAEKGSRTWKKYVDCKRLEITCGEAPYLVSRYDTVTGQTIPVPERIGLLDRKLRVVCENTESKEDWKTWARRAVESVYGYEFQGDNLLLARENVLYTYIEYYRQKFEEEPDLKELLQIALVISWNLWQMDGFNYAIYTMLKDYKSQVTVKIASIAASAASVIAMAGDKVLMSPTALLMIHDPATIAMGNAKAMEQAITTLNEVKESIINAYAAKSGQRRSKIADLMSNETWMNAKKAVELGFADEILYEDKEKPEPESDPDKDSPDDPDDPEKEKKGAPTLEAILYQGKVTDRAVLNSICDQTGPEEKTRAEPEVPMIGMDGKTKDGAMPYEILRNQLDFLK